jgi:hypothetical protein
VVLIGTEELASLLSRCGYPVLVSALSAETEPALFAEAPSEVEGEAEGAGILILVWIVWDGHSCPSLLTFGSCQNYHDRGAPSFASFAKGGDL